ncbi:Cif family virulence factor [Tsuneonella amylolytica]|uniref:hypothetical protein n=1 Tax=Tsuneonella amylolytica TaxID=2338327 RepID=UPI000EA83ED3|nr:hypothetical protein [Tsuneonella amylolytica]
MRRLAALAMLVLAGCATPPAQRERVLRPVAAPSTVIATELAFARAARDEGTWTAFRTYATKDAVWPGPQWENVQTALKGVADPAEPFVWEPDAIWSSCDGSFALSTGPATLPGGRKTRFATIWQRQDDGEYRWVLDQGFDPDAGYSKPEMIAARVAECAAPTTAFRYSRDKLPKARRGEAWQAGASDDGTLSWTTALHADCSRTFVVTARQGGEMREVFRRVSPVPPVAASNAAPVC